MKRIALKIDIDTYRGTLIGVPTLVEILRRQEAQATFFFSLGADQSGRDSRASSPARYYDLKTRLYGRLLPAPQIGTRCKDIIHQVAQTGFEVGIHAWNRFQWERHIHERDNPWVETEMQKACARFSQIVGADVKGHAAAGWRTNRHALRLTQRLNLSYASDCRGRHPFIPVIDGEIVACPQLPTTLPTLDEIMALNTQFSPEQAAEAILECAQSIEGDHVYTLRAELEGMRFSAAFERLLTAWKNAGYTLVGLSDLRDGLDLKSLPRHIVEFREIAGRAEPRAHQGDVFLAE